MRTLLWILPLVTLGTSVVGMTDDQSQRLQRVFAVDLVPQCMTQDQVLRPTDPTCQAGTLCTSWQAIPESTIGSIRVGRHAALFVDFDGNYNCDGCADAFGFPFVQARIQLSTDGDLFEEVTEQYLTRGNYVPNAGVDVVRRRMVPVAPGNYTIRMQQRFTIDAANSPLPRALCLKEGTMHIEVLFRR